VGHVDEISLGQLAGPILLEGGLHLALAANAGETCGSDAATAKGQVRSRDFRKGQYPDASQLQTDRSDI
jgi:hypothetical protein